MPPTPPVRRIHPESDPAAVAALVETLCHAFDRDDHINWIIRQDKKREEAARKFFYMLLSDLLGSHGELYATEDLKAAAVWFPPGANSLGLATQVRVGIRFAEITGWRRLPITAYGLNRMEMRHPAQPHYFLQTLGVTPNLQAKGYGSALLRQLLVACDAAGTCSYLETTNESNLPFYARHGFKVMSECLLPHGPRLWQMLRDPD